jgi:general secretion pathway protein C
MNMASRRTPLYIHLLGAAAASALAAYWVLRLLTPAPPVVPAIGAAVAVRDPDPRLAARMFGDVNGGVVVVTRNVQVSGVYVAGKNSSAVVAVDGKPPRAVLLGREAAPGLRLVDVRADGITLEGDGVRTDYAVPLPSLAHASAPAPLFRRDGDVLTAPSQDAVVANRPVPPQSPLANRFSGAVAPSPPSGMLVPPAQQRGGADEANGRYGQPPPGAGSSPGG